MEWKSPDSRPVQAEPEILPPTERDDSGGYVRGQERLDVPSAPGHRPNRARWATAPATYTLVAINCLVYLAMAFSGVSWREPSVQDLLHWGANAGPYVLIGHQWWRLVTAAFVHAGPLHIATNMWCLWNLGLLGEPLLGALGTFAVYVLTGAAGNLLSVALHPGVNGHPGIVGVGASGAVFGLAGVLIVLLKSPLLPVPPAELRHLRRSVINFAVLNFVFGASTLFFPSVVRIDNMAHLGGFLCGLAVGVPLVPRIGAPRSQFLLRRRIAYSGMLLLLFVFAFGITSFWR